MRTTKKYIQSDQSILLSTLRDKYFKRQLLKQANDFLQQMEDEKRQTELDKIAENERISQEIFYEITNLKLF